MTNAEGGLARVQASMRSNGHQARSNIAEIAAYSHLRVAGPSYFSSLKNLYSVDQHGQEFQSFDSLIPKDQIRRFALAFGSNVDLLLQGGSNYWKSYSDEYLTTWFVEKSNATSSDVLLIQKASQNYTEVYISIKC